LFRTSFILLKCLCYKLITGWRTRVGRLVIVAVKDMYYIQLGRANWSFSFTGSPCGKRNSFCSDTLIQSHSFQYNCLIWLGGYYGAHLHRCCGPVFPFYRIPWWKVPGWPGVDVMITIFCDFCQFSAKKFGVFFQKPMLW
jgi:hypothetical protein